MKGIQKRIYTVLPRVVSSSTSSSTATGSASALPSTSTAPPLTRARSNSASSSSSSSRSLYTSSTNSGSPLAFFDSPPPPPPSSRGHPHVLSTSRLPVEAKHQADAPPNPPFPLALTSPINNSAYSAQANGSTNAYALFSNSNFKTGPLASAAATGAKGNGRRVAAKRQRPKYQLNVGAYGIPKRCNAGVGGREAYSPHARMMHLQARDDAQLAVQVGEDAYFIRDNAMGVADGVGGWAKARCPDNLHGRSYTADNSPSALFARRLMHFCSAEMDAIQSSPSLPCVYSTPRPSFSPIPPPRASLLPLPRASTSSWFSSPTSNLSSIPTVNSWPWSPNIDLQHELEEELEELEEGIDILMILEKAYEKTLKAHVMPVSEPELQLPRPSEGEGLPISSVSFSSSPPTSSVPICTSMPTPTGADTTIPLLAGSSTALLAVLDHVPAMKASPNTEPTSEAALRTDATRDMEAVIKIAHIGDCMAMLVRGDEIAWRSEEMWWDFNTPVQLGPTSPVQPVTSAQLFTLPVQADDILILASDGLSDNLWDEDVLDEVVRFRNNFLESEEESASSGIAPSTPSMKHEDQEKPKEGAAERVLRRRMLAGMLSEALCSRARKVSERRVPKSVSMTCRKEVPPVSQCGSSIPTSINAAMGSQPTPNLTATAAGRHDEEVPFARRAREAGKVFRGGKNDGWRYWNPLRIPQFIYRAILKEHISVIVAVISPAADLAQQNQSH